MTLPLKSDVNVALKSNKQKKLGKTLILAAILKVTDENSRIRSPTLLDSVKEDLHYWCVGILS
jgi:hypothetical protein